MMCVSHLNDKSLYFKELKMNSDLVSSVSDSIAKVLEEFIPAANSTNDAELLTVAETCKLLKVSRHTIHRWCKSGKIKFVKFSKAKSGAVRIYKASIIVFLKTMGA